MRSYLGAAGAVFRRDLTVFLSYRIRFVTTLLSSVFSITLFYYLSRLVRVERFPTPDDYFAFAVVGLIILSVLQSTLAGPPLLVRQELVAGTFERMALTPFGPTWSLLSTLLFPFAFAMAIAVGMLVLAAVLFGLDVSWSTAPLAVPLGALGAFAFMPFGVLLLAAVIVAKQAAGGAAWVLTLISLVAGLYFPVEVLPEWIRWTSEVQPFTPATDLLRHVLVDTPLRDSWAEGLAKLVGFTVVLLPLSLLVADRAIRVGRRRGTLTEY